MPVWAALTLLIPAITLHASLTHEVIHGHPFRYAAINRLLVWPPLTLVVPYDRFRDTHLAHHRDPLLTDPYDDPESNYLAPDVWHALPGPLRLLLRANNTLAGRLTLGPVIGTIAFLAKDALGARRDATIRRAWLAHLPAAGTVLILVALAPLPLWVYGISVYGALSLLRLRTFLEHRAHPLPRARTALVEDRGPLALLFLNNNLHVVHHVHPGVPWYRLPALYRAGRARYLARNEGYLYRSYGQVIRRHLVRAKDPVPHPLRPHVVGTVVSVPMPSAHPTV